MNTKPRIIDYVFLALAVLCFLFMLIFMIVKYPSLPDLLPSHYNARGEIDGWSGKAAAAFFPPIVGFLMLAIMGPIQFFPKMEGFFACICVCTARLSPLPGFVSYLFMGMTALIIVFILVQTFRK